MSQSLGGFALPRGTLFDSRKRNAIEVVEGRE